MKWLISLTGYLAPAFIILSPVLSYSDQAYSMYRKRSSAGFSLDIPLIMLVASLFKIFYWPGARFDNSLLVQAVLMIIIQTGVLKIALDCRNRPLPRGGDALSISTEEEQGGILGAPRPFGFWQWRSPKPYWHFLLFVFVGLVICELVLAPLPPLYALYYPFIGYFGLAVEALLPLPQILANEQARSCSGFRPSVLISWLIGDTIKIFWFFTTPTHIPWAFKLCALFQTACDFYLCLQFYLFGSSPGPATRLGKEQELLTRPSDGIEASLSRRDV